MQYYWKGWQRRTSCRRDGKDGLNGVNGTNGKDGRNGKNGEDGKDGQNGIDGKIVKSQKRNWKECAWANVNDGKDSGIVIKVYEDVYN